MDAEELAHKQALIKEHTRTLREYELQAAEYGELDVPVYIRKQIRGVKEQIEELKKEIGIHVPKEKDDFMQISNRTSRTRPQPPRLSAILDLDEDLPALKPRRRTTSDKPVPRLILGETVDNTPETVQARQYIHNQTILGGMSLHPWLLLLLAALALILYLLASNPQKGIAPRWNEPSYFVTPTATISDQ
jgi:hypothetical protein